MPRQEIILNRLAVQQNLLLSSDCPMEVSTCVLLPSWLIRTTTLHQKIGDAVQYDIINFEPYKKFQKFFDMMYMF